MVNSLNTLVVSLRSDEWKKLSEAERKNMDLTFADDGEFWQVHKYQYFSVSHSIVVCGCFQANIFG